jgi:hypothetical protein
VSILLYGFAECGPEGVAGLGVARRPVTAIGGRELVALVSEHDAPPSATEDTLWSYEHVLAEHMARHAVIPARFGTVFDGVEPIELVLTERGHELEAGFALVRGALELAVRVSGEPAAHDADQPAGDRPGRAYLMERVSRSRDADQLAAALQSRLDPLARATRYRTLVAPDIPVSAAYLIERDRMAQFIATVGDLQSELGGRAALTCTGPWPPFSFVEDSVGG